MKSITEICEFLILAMSTVTVLVLICGVMKQRLSLSKMKSVMLIKPVSCGRSKMSLVPMCFSHKKF